MKSSITRFPARRDRLVRIVRYEGELYVVCHEHGTNYGDRPSALKDAKWIRENKGMTGVLDTGGKLL